MGPQKQLRMMFDPVRLYATAIYVGCVVLALIFALGVRNIQIVLSPPSFSQPYSLVIKLIRHVPKSHITMPCAFGLPLQIHDKLLTLIAIICEICALFW